MKRYGWVLVLVSWAWQSSAAVAAHSVTWNREPIRVTLVVGWEQRLDFPDAVRAGIPARLGRGPALRVQSIGTSLYLKASAAFDTQRVYATLIGTGQVVVFDISAAESQVSGAEQAPPGPIRVHVSDAFDDAAAALDASDGPAPTGERSVTPIVLARFAAQQFYAPLRLLRVHPGIERVPLRTAAAGGLYAGGEVQAEALAGWRGGRWFVTAVRLVNRTAQSVQLNPRKLRGALVHAVFQHKSLRLGPRGDATDTTLVYLITDRPFEEAVLPRI